VGVARQYCGRLGKTDNCQVAVTLSIANHQASLPIAYRLRPGFCAVGPQQVTRQQWDIADEFFSGDDYADQLIRHELDLPDLRQSRGWLDALALKV
jgi:DDE superfamily endonuclease